MYKCFEGKLVGEKEEGDYFESKNLSWQLAALTPTLLIILPLLFLQLCIFKMYFGKRNITITLIIILPFVIFD